MGRSGSGIGFNPRTREGATVRHGTGIERRKVSIHAPVRVRLLVSLLWDITRSFNPRTREGATRAGDS